MKINKKIFETENFVKDSAKYLYNLIEEKLKIKNSITIALSGGSTPIPILMHLAQYKINWNKIDFFLVDERDVSLNSDESNYKIINNCFISKIGLELYPMRINEDLIISSKNYQSYLEHKFQNILPEFDITLLGMGLDGHIASLFPDTEALKENEKWVIPNYISKLNTYRMTLTFPVIFNSQNIVLITKGEKKEKIIEIKNDTNLPIHKLISKTEIEWLHTN